jgi:hypothetical protein
MHTGGCQPDRFWQFQDALHNTPVQGTAADITKKALALLPQRVEDTGANIIGTVHDEIILEVPDRLAGEVAVILKETMIPAGKAFLGRVPVEAEVTIGEVWAEKGGQAPGEDGFKFAVIWVAEKMGMPSAQIAHA